jgi:hypothetical protein
MAALCQSLLRLREASRAALIVVHHVRKSIGRYEIGSAFRGSSTLHAVGDSYLLLTRPAPQFHTVELLVLGRSAFAHQEKIPDPIPLRTAVATGEHCLAAAKAGDSDLS